VSRIFFRRIRRDQIVGDEETNALFGNDRALDQAIDSLVDSTEALAVDVGAAADGLAAHRADTGNPHGVTAAQVGAARASDLAAHLAATNPHGLTPATIGAAPAAGLQAVEFDLAAHLAAATNPHGVTAAQVGAPTLADLALHTGNANNPHLVSYDQVGAAPDSHVGDGGAAHAPATASTAGFMTPGHVQQLAKLEAALGTVQTTIQGSFKWGGGEWWATRTRGLEDIAPFLDTGLAEIRFAEDLELDPYAYTVELTCHGAADHRPIGLVHDKQPRAVLVQFVLAPDFQPYDAVDFDIVIRTME
jgi:hypothetical protein